MPLQVRDILNFIDKGQALRIRNEEVQGIVRKINDKRYHVCFTHNLKVYSLSKVGLSKFLIDQKLN